MMPRPPINPHFQEPAIIRYGGNQRPCSDKCRFCHEVIGATTGDEALQSYQNLGRRVPILIGISPAGEDLKADFSDPPVDFRLQPYVIAMAGQ